MFKINFTYIVLISYLINNFSQLLSNPAPIIVNNLNNDEFLLHSPLRFTTNGINNFLTYTYNHPKYASEIVPHNTGHFMQLLEHGKISKQDSDYMIAVLRLLRQKISATEYMSAAELERITSVIPTILIDYMDPKSPIYHKTSSRKLKNVLIHVIENCLNKTLWNSSEAEQMTSQLIKIGNNLANLERAGIIADEDDLNDLIHSLLDRFIYVLSLSSNNLPLSFYEELSKQLHQAAWMKIAEIESAIDSKIKKVEQAFLKSKLKSHASETLGIV